MWIERSQERGPLVSHDHISILVDDAVMNEQSLNPSVSKVVNARRPQKESQRIHECVFVRNLEINTSKTESRTMNV